jgi:hypothetical protein
MRPEQVVPRLAQLFEWGWQITAELSVLPQTLTQLREGAENFQRVTKRLLDATESLERINQLQGQAIKSVRDQMTTTPGAVRMVGALDDLNEALGSLGGLNPFWPREGSRETERGGD